MDLGINNCQNLLNKYPNNFSKSLKIIYPLVYQSLAEGLKSQPAGLAKNKREKIRKKGERKIQICMHSDKNIDK